MIPLLARRGAETDERSESDEAGWWMFFGFNITIREIFNSECLIYFDSTTPAHIHLHLQCSLMRATSPDQVFHPDIERSEIIGKGSLFCTFICNRCWILFYPV